MPDIQTPHRTGPALTLRTAAAWMVTFAGFPLGSVAAGLIAGPVDGPVAALAGGFITGAVIGGLQAWGLGHNRPPALQWVLATALGLMLGLWAGAGLVGFATDPPLSSSRARSAVPRSASPKASSWSVGWVFSPSDGRCC